MSQAERRAWQPLIEGYTRTRRALALFVILIDARRGIEDEERQLYEWLGTENVPAQIVFTKVDKLPASARGLLRERARASFRGGRRSGGRCSCRARRARASTRCGRRSSTPSGAPRRRQPNLRRGPARLASSGKRRMAVNKLQQAFDVEPMRLGDVDAVMAIERRVVPLADDRRRLLLEEMGREWAHVDVVRDRAAPERRRVQQLLGGRRRGAPAEPGDSSGGAPAPGTRRGCSRTSSRWAATRSCRFVTLEVRRSNAAALRLYRRFGFRAVGVRPNYYAEDQEDAIVMLLDLA